MLHFLHSYNIIYSGDDTMKTIPQNEYINYISAASSMDICRVYPMSVAERLQNGQIYTDNGISLFRHKNNFAFITGTPTADFIDEIYSLIINGGMKFMCTDNAVCETIAKRPDIATATRYLYDFPSDSAPLLTLPDGYSFANIDKDTFNAITGRVAPSVFWDSAEDFLTNGIGVCVMHGSKPVSWAFSAAISSDEFDIGIQTAEAHRGKGLSKAAAAKLINDMLPYKRPTWMCHSTNKGSAHIAESLGFRKYGQCTMLKRAD